VPATTRLTQEAAYALEASAWLAMYGHIPGDPLHGLRRGAKTRPADPFFHCGMHPAAAAARGPPAHPHPDWQGALTIIAGCFEKHRIR
jgi:hypothetical protein